MNWKDWGAPLSAPAIAPRPQNSMGQQFTQVSRTAIDAVIDGWIGRPAGITLSFALCEGFMRGGLLEQVEYFVGGEQWLLRTYRGRVVQPDPALEEFDFYFGLRVL